MSDNLNGWVRASERMPTEEDADELGYIWCLCPFNQIVIPFPSDQVGAEMTWHPKPRVVPPAPPKIEERKRRTCWRNVYRESFGEELGHTAFGSIGSAQASAREQKRCIGQVEFREVLLDDPTRSELLNMIESLSFQITGYRLEDKTTEVIENARTMLKMLARE